MKTNKLNNSIKGNKNLAFLSSNNLKLNEMKTINFDMDGTIADLYSVDGWLNMLRNYDSTPYLEAKPMYDLESISNLCNNLQKRGYKINIITWLAKVSNSEYDTKVTEAKIEWLKEHMNVKFDNIYAVPYGTPKSSISSGILFDDNEDVRNEWGSNAYEPQDIIEILTQL